MADDNALNMNNLCTTEDAFEQFQAVSMYQEDEFITLSDLMPSEPRAVDSDELLKIPYDNEVVLTTSDVCEDVLKASGPSVPEPSNSHLDTDKKEEPSFESDVKPAPKKRGRTKKNHHEINSVQLSGTDESQNKHEINSNSQEKDCENSELLKNNIPSHVTRVKRGRPPKKRVNDDITTSCSESKHTKPISNSSETLTTEPDDSVPIVSNRKQGRPAQKKRGRPPKAKILDIQTLPAADSTTTENQQLSEISSSENDNSFNKVEKTLQKRRRVRKNYTDLFAGSNTIAGSLNENYVTDINNSLLTANERGSAKRFKKDTEHSLTDQNEVESNTDFNPLEDKELNNPNLSENDELDEMSLSELKKMPDETKPHSTATDLATTENNLDTSKNNDSVLSDSVTKTPRKGKKGRPKKVSVDSLPHTTENIEPKVETLPIENKHIEDDEKDNLSLSKLKQTLDTDDAPAVVSSDMVNQETPSKRSTKMPIMSDFEYNIDSIVKNDVEVDDSADQSLLVEDHTKRPIRRKTKQALHYDESSDEDPFANMESSDDEPRKHRKGNKYYSDDEYRPGFVIGKNAETSDSEISENLEETKKKKKGRKQTDTQSPRKRGKKSDTNVLNKNNVAQTGQHVDDIEEVLQSSVITAGDEQTRPSLAWGSSNEFENFIAKKIQGTDLKIKKVTAIESSEKNVTPLEIPVIVPEAKKTVEMCSQTNTIKTETAGVQTTLQYDIPMKENVALTKEQSEKACQFLNSIVQTTAELGQLMTQKSEDFIKKKIHTEHVTDTFKMDYCVKKSFLLFKLAKHNLLQMEDDLAKQYEDFLQSNNLMLCREQPKQLIAKPKTDGSDSDCEIVEEIKPPGKSEVKPKFNPKTVFLNKELSIKIAKKPNETQSTPKKINIKGRHTVWINDTVVVKKVKPMQSFLAQDSRNKKPPDNFVTIEMVSEFFKKYYRQQAVTICAPFLTTEWRNMATECVCNYFVVEPVKLDTGTTHPDNNELSINNESGSVFVPAVMTINDVKHAPNSITRPESLFKMCFRILKNNLCVDHHKTNKPADGNEQPIKLFHLCLSALNRSFVDRGNSNSISTKIRTGYNTPFTVNSLKTLCYRRILELDFNSNMKHKETQNEEISSNKYHNVSIRLSQPIKNNPKSLFSLCVKLIQSEMYCTKLLCTQSFIPNTLKQIAFENVIHLQSFIPNTLKQIAFENIIHLMYKNTKDINSTKKSLRPICNMDKLTDDVPIGILTINSVNTLSEEAFLNLEQDISGNSDDIDDIENDDSNMYEDSHFEPDIDSNDDNVSNETNWVSQVQMAELKYCSNPFNAIEDLEQNNESLTTRIKIEPLEDPFQNINDPPVVKTEPGVNLDEMTIIPDVETIKPEITGDINARTVQRQNSSSYDVEAFESFVRTSKMMNNIDEYSNEDIFSQSALRVRRQHEPDLDEDIDMNMSLLVPQTYEPLNIETAKGSLMETSSDEGSKQKKVIGKKRRGRPKKTNSKNTPSAATKDKVTNNEVATITRRMRDKIRQEEQKELSSDSEIEDIPLGLRSKKNYHSEKPATNESAADEIQCNNVDSTKTVTDDIAEEFPGFTAIDQNETTSYQKLMKYVYDKIVPNTEDDGKSKNKSTVSKDKRKIESCEKPCASLFDSNEPVELLECEPTMPIFEDKPVTNNKKLVKKTTTVEPEMPILEDKPVTNNKKLVIKNTRVEPAMPILEDKPVTNNKKLVIKNTRVEPTMPIVEDKPITNNKKFVKNTPTVEPSTSFVEHDGWKFYPVNKEDIKLYQRAHVSLEKLPESFVETYFQYQDITQKNKDDVEVERLTNLNTLNRASNLKDGKIRGKSKRGSKDQISEPPNEIGSRPCSPANSGHYDELTPSEDEGQKAEDELPPAAPRQTENILAKDSLMNDNDSDSDRGTKVKEEPAAPDLRKHPKIGKRKQIILTKEENVESDSLMLTADKMMNKELTLLHAPVVLNDGDVNTSNKQGVNTRSKQKSATKQQPLKGQIKCEDDSSSEEEKQWVTTKEKLLKRLGKREDTSVDDAKRAKLVSEFIERRGDVADSHKRPRGKTGRRSRKKFFERQKQLRVLSMELFGEASIDPGHNKRSAQAYFKGRRNIRKVIDKKSLARSTVIANMEEFERKRRLNTRQAQLNKPISHGTDTQEGGTSISIQSHDTHGVLPANNVTTSTVTSSTTTGSASNTGGIRAKKRTRAIVKPISDPTNLEEEVNSEEETAFDVFGKCVAMQLKALSVENGLLAQCNIQNILTEFGLKDFREKIASKSSIPDVNNQMPHPEISESFDTLNVSLENTVFTSPSLSRTADPTDILMPSELNQMYVVSTQDIIASAMTAAFDNHEELNMS